MTEPIYSPGLEGIVAGETAISTISGGLQYRGYSIEELASHATWEEVLYLVLYGELPTAAEVAALAQTARGGGRVPAGADQTLGKIPNDVPLMDVMRTGASLLAHWDVDVRDNSTAANLPQSRTLSWPSSPVVMAARHRLAAWSSR